MPVRFLFIEPPQKALEEVGQPVICRASKNNTSPLRDSHAIVDEEGEFRVFHEPVDGHGWVPHPGIGIGNAQEEIQGRPQ